MIIFMYSKFITNIQCKKSHHPIFHGYFTLMETRSNNIFLPIDIRKEKNQISLRGSRFPPPKFGILI